MEHGNTATCGSDPPDSYSVELPVPPVAHLNTKTKKHESFGVELDSDLQA